MGEYKSIKVWGLAGPSSAAANLTVRGHAPTFQNFLLQSPRFASEAN